MRFRRARLFSVSVLPSHSFFSTTCNPEQSDRRFRHCRKGPGFRSHTTHSCRPVFTRQPPQPPPWVVRPTRRRAFPHSLPLSPLRLNLCRRSRGRGPTHHSAPETTRSAIRPLRFHPAHRAPVFPARRPNRFPLAPCLRRCPALRELALQIPSSSATRSNRLG